MAGSREALILQPGDASWPALWPVIRARNYVFDVDAARYSRLAEPVPRAHPAGFGSSQA
jgi:hypothetical protein